MFIDLKKAASAIKLPVGNQMWVCFELYACIFFLPLICLLDWELPQSKDRYKTGIQDLLNFHLFSPERWNITISKCLADFKHRVKVYPRTIYEVPYLKSTLRASHFFLLYNVLPLEILIRCRCLNAVYLKIKAHPKLCLQNSIILTWNNKSWSLASM